MPELQISAHDGRVGAAPNSAALITGSRASVDVMTIKIVVHAQDTLILINHLTGLVGGVPAKHS
jgi:hypothetical protein